MACWVKMQRSFKQGAGKMKLSFILVETLQKQPLLSSWMLKIHFLSNVNINLLSNLQFMRVVILISNISWLIFFSMKKIWPRLPLIYVKSQAAFTVVYFMVREAWLLLEHEDFQIGSLSLPNSLKTEL